MVRLNRKSHEIQLILDLNFKSKIIVLQCKPNDMGRNQQRQIYINKRHQSQTVYSSIDRRGNPARWIFIVFFCLLLTFWSFVYLFDMWPVNCCFVNIRVLISCAKAII